MKPTKHVVYQLLVSFLLGLAFVGCSGEENPQPQQEILRPVRTVSINTALNGAEREFPGVVDASQKVDLGFLVGGKLEMFSVKEGDKVKKGQVIGRLNQTDFTIRLKSRQSEYDLAKTNFERGQVLKKEGAISRADYDKLKVNFTTAQAQLEAAQQDLNNSELKAPFTGHIARRYVENYEQVKAGQAVVMLQDISSLLVRIDVPESVVFGIKRKRHTRGKHARFDAIKDRQFPLTFKEFSTRAADDSQTFTATFTMDVPDQYNVLPGMTAMVVIGPGKGREKQQPIFILPIAVLEDQNGHFVYLAVPSGEQEALIQRHPVKIGRLDVRGIEIVQGLKNGDRVVTAGMSKLRNGLRVRLMGEAVK